MPKVTAKRGEARRWIVDHKDFAGDECLQWPFAIHKKTGYGAATDDDGRPITASRLMCKEAHGEPPTPKHDAAHSCGRGKNGCVNPRHLRWATKKENHQDAIAHGTHSGLRYKGSAHHLAQIDEASAALIKRRLLDGEDYRDISADLGVSFHVARNIKYGATWKDVPAGQC